MAWVRELAGATLFLVLLLAGSYAGLLLQRSPREHHRSRETVDAIRLVITMLVTFAALVLGLLVNSVKSNFDGHTNQVRQYGIQLIQLDMRLREYGPEADAIRALMRRYLAAAIASTWPDEVPPSGSYPIGVTSFTAKSIEGTTLTAMLMSAERMIEQVNPASPLQERVAPLLRASMQRTLQDRWTLIETAHPTISWPFLLLLTFWLVIIFAVFGLTSPRNGVTQVVIVLSALSLASSLYLILDLDVAFEGIITVSSEPLRDALVHMDQPG